MLPHLSLLPGESLVSWAARSAQAQTGMDLPYVAAFTGLERAALLAPKPNDLISIADLFGDNAQSLGDIAVHFHGPEMLRYRARSSVKISSLGIARHSVRSALPKIRTLTDGFSGTSKRRAPAPGTRSRSSKRHWLAPMTSFRHRPSFIPRITSLRIKLTPIASSRFRRCRSTSSAASSGRAVRLGRTRNVQIRPHAPPEHWGSRGCTGPKSRRLRSRQGR